mmetsp:Transcript_31344/g.65549  ORF Transcript_31344/g.65549 Transcript_31344/m.65549 type:complete len:152 (-) Transcript_31344:115-570(-)
MKFQVQSTLFILSTVVLASASTPITASHTSDVSTTKTMSSRPQLLSQSNQGRGVRGLGALFDLEPDQIEKCVEGCYGGDRDLERKCIQKCYKQSSGNNNSKKRKNDVNSNDGVNAPQVDVSASRVVCRKNCNKKWKGVSRQKRKECFKTCG